MKLAESILKLNEKMSDIMSGYLEAALWSSTDLDNDDEPFDSDFTIYDFSKDAMKKSEKDISKFEKMAKRELEDLDADDTQIGHDIWLSRNGHGAGFFDRDYADQKILDKLQSYAEKLGSVNLLSNDGKVEIE